MGRCSTLSCVEHVQLTILEECWRLSFAHSLVPKLTPSGAISTNTSTTTTPTGATPAVTPKAPSPPKIVDGARPQDASSAMTSRTYSGLA